MKDQQIDLIKLLQSINAPEIRFAKLKKAPLISINQLNNGLMLVLYYPTKDVCTTNHYYANAEPAGIKKQFICENKNGFGHPITPGCDHGTFEQLNINDLPENWQKNAMLKMASSPKLKGAYRIC